MSSQINMTLGQRNSVASCVKFQAQTRKIKFLTGTFPTVNQTGRFYEPNKSHVGRVQRALCSEGVLSCKTLFGCLKTETCLCVCFDENQCNQDEVQMTIVVDGLTEP